MAVDTFIPEVWNAELLTALPTQYIFAQGGVVNHDYEGDISAYGDTVHIGALSAPSIANYVKNTTQIDPATLTTTEQLLLIDQAKYFAFELDDIDARQVRDNGQVMTKAAELAARGLSAAADTFLSGLMVAGAGTVLPATALSTSDATAAQNGAYVLIRKARVALDKANVPATGRFLIVSPEFYAVLLGDPRFVDVSKYGSSAGIMNGEVGRIVGFSVIVSNTIPQGTAGTAPAVSNFLVAGHSMATTYAEQISKTEAYRPQNSFSDAVKGLHLYGAKVVRPEALVVCDVDVTVL
ncbi:N4-gp56 family major capsid protein [Amycolatopsis orientalis]|uniref:N4-gp56 family major capsid protein n=1 Tax=Amycolatopsis orientalis TaxID=31958 RepID=UPI000567388C|nr:N4-gp56 family major capsid protein [Amycolatopsis orientalis]